jgi:hypothetical protein
MIRFEEGDGVGELSDDEQDDDEAATASAKKGLRNQETEDEEDEEDDSAEEDMSLDSAENEKEVRARAPVPSWIWTLSLRDALCVCCRGCSMRLIGTGLTRSDVSGT